MSKQPYKRTGVCGCGATYEAKDRWQRSCEKCIEAKNAYEAMRPPRICRKCGAEVRGAFHLRMCSACYKAHKDAKEAERQAWLARSRREKQGLQKRQDKPKPTDTESISRHVEEEYGPLFDLLAFRFYLTATPDKQAALRDIWRKNKQRMLLEMIGETFVEEVEPVDLEQVPADEQDAIDATAAGLLADLDI